jgi:hypothetical protein
MKTAKLLGLGALAIMILACGGGGGTTAEVPDPTIRVVNLSPSVGVDFYVNDTVVASNVATGGSSPSFLPTENAEQDYALHETGSGIAIDSQSKTLNKNSNHLAIAFGLKDFGTENAKRLRFDFFEVFRLAPNGNKARVYAFNAFVRTPGEDSYAVVFKNPGLNPVLQMSPVDFGQITSAEIDAGPITLTAQRQFTETEVVTVTKDFEAGKIYLMVFGGQDPTPTITFFEIQPK